MQFIKDLREVTGAIKELVADDERHEEDAKLELAFSAQSFAQEAREVVDDKLSFSATLMRAGEVDAAKRLLAEVEAEVRDSEVALIEQVNEVKVARAARRERITRMRLARSLAVAMLGAAVMATSAAGMAFASFLDDRAQSAEATASAPRGRTGSARRDATPVAARRQPARKAGKVQFHGVSGVLDAEALAAYEQLTSGDIDAAEMEHLLSLLPTQLADTMRQVLNTAHVARKAVTESIPDVLTRATRKAKGAAKADEQPAAGEEKEADPANTEPEEEPTPEPTPSGGGEETQEEPDEDPDDTMGLPDVGPN